MKSDWRKLSRNPSLWPYILQRHGFYTLLKMADTWWWHSRGLWPGALLRTSWLVPASGWSQHTCPSKSLLAPRHLHSGCRALALVLDSPGVYILPPQGSSANLIAVQQTCINSQLLCSYWQVWDQMRLKGWSQGVTPSWQRALALCQSPPQRRGSEQCVRGDGFLSHRGLGGPVTAPLLYLELGEQWCP